MAVEPAVLPGGSVNSAADARTGPMPAPVVHAGPVARASGGDATAGLSGIGPTRTAGVQRKAGKSMPARHKSQPNPSSRRVMAATRSGRRLTDPQFSRTSSRRGLTKTYVRIEPSAYTSLWNLPRGPPEYAAGVPPVLADEVSQDKFDEDLRAFQAHVPEAHAFLRKARHFKWMWVALATLCLLTLLGSFVYFKYLDDDDDDSALGGIPVWLLVLVLVLPLLPLPLGWYIARRARVVVERQREALQHVADQLNSHTYAVLGARWQLDLTSRLMTLWTSQDGEPWVFFPVPVLELAVPLPLAHEQQAGAARGATKVI